MFSNVWSENTALFERLMEIHSNSPKLYYGFNFVFEISMYFLEEEIQIFLLGPLVNLPPPPPPLPPG